MNNKLLKQISLQINLTKGAIVIDPKEATREYIQDIVDVAKKHGKLSDVIVAPITCSDDFKVLPDNHKTILTDDVGEVQILE